MVLSRNSHDLLLQWLSGAGLDEEWEMGRHSVAGRAKSAVNGIIVNRIRAEGELLLPSRLQYLALTICSA